MTDEQIPKMTSFDNCSRLFLVLRILCNILQEAARDTTLERYIHKTYIGVGGIRLQSLHTFYEYLILKISTKIYTFLQPAPRSFANVSF